MTGGGTTTGALGGEGAAQAVTSIDSSSMIGGQGRGACLGIVYLLIARGGASLFLGAVGLARDAGGGLGALALLCAVQTLGRQRRLRMPEAQGLHPAPRRRGQPGGQQHRQADAREQRGNHSASTPSTASRASRWLRGHLSGCGLPGRHRRSA